MITRFVPSSPGASRPGVADLDDAATSGGGPLSNQLGRPIRTSAPEDILRQAHATSLTGIFNQIAAVAEHSFELFNELKDESARLSERFQRVQDRVSTIAEVVTSNNNQTKHQIAIKRLPTREESDTVLAISEISFSRTAARHPAIAEAYAKCEPMPALELDSQSAASGEVISLSRKKYSNPSFFVNEWMKKESSRHQRALQAKEDRRRERRELKRGQSLSQQPAQVRDDSSEPSNNKANSTAGSEHNVNRSQQRTASGGSNKFLKIRSWREIYGTGEGKELARQQQTSSTPAPGGPSKLDGKKKSSKKSLTAAVSGEAQQADSLSLPDIAAEAPHPAPQPNHHVQNEVQTVIDQQQPHQQLYRFGYDICEDYAASACLPPPPPPPPVTSPICSGAFMQEIDDDDEIFYELSEGDAFALDGGGSNRNPESEEFVDHGLSYYYDPASAQHQLVPPPPPPPPPATLDELNDNEGSNEQMAFHGIPMDECSLEDEDFVPPPPPLPPAPGLPIEATAEDSGIPILSRPPSCLLREIQQGASLRHITIDEEHEEEQGELAIGSQASPDKTTHKDEASVEAALASLSLLEQIKMKQRNLRPVEPMAPRRPSVSKSAAPFADSIARILERRSMIAYDSDSSDGDAERSNSSDYDW